MDSKNAKAVHHYLVIDGRPPKSKIPLLKWGFAILLAIFGGFQIVRRFNAIENRSGSTAIVFPDLYEASVLDLQGGLDAGHFSSVDLVKTYFARISNVNQRGPKLRAVSELNPSALDQAAVLDEERKITGKRSLLHGIPILLKDNIGTITSEGMGTTAGSYSLFGSTVPDDAGVVKRLRAAGAIILGKTSLSELD